MTKRLTSVTLSRTFVILLLTTTKYMELQQEPKNIHDILRGVPGYSIKLAKACNTNASNVLQVVALERFTSKYWPSIEALAMEADPKAYKARVRFIKSQILNHRKAA